MVWQQLPLSAPLLVLSGSFNTYLHQYSHEQSLRTFKRDAEIAMSFLSGIKIESWPRILCSYGGVNLCGPFHRLALVVFWFVEDNKQVASERHFRYLRQQVVCRYLIEP